MDFPADCNSNINVLCQLEWMKKKDPVVGDLDSSPLCKLNWYSLDTVPIEQIAWQNLSLVFYMQIKVDIKMKIKQCDKLSKTIKEKGPY